MKLIKTLLTIILFNSLYAQDNSTILLITNQNAVVNFDGEDIGNVEANKPFRIVTNKGEHLVHLEAEIDGEKKFKDEIVVINDEKQKIVRVNFDNEVAPTTAPVTTKIENTKPAEIFNSFSFYTLQGEKFYLIIDGKKQNEVPDTKVEIHNLNDNKHTIKIIFEKQELGSIDDEFKTVNANGVIIDRKYQIARNKRSNYYELNPISTNYKAGTSVWEGVAEGLNAASAQINENMKPDCEKQQYGYINISNTSSNSYNVYLNGAYHDRLAGGYNKTLTIKSGSYQIKVEQVNGYLMYPTIKTATIVIGNCQTSPTYVFP